MFKTLVQRATVCSSLIAIMFTANQNIQESRMTLPQSTPQSPLALGAAKAAIHQL
jgi:hypothetical protein